MIIRHAPATDPANVPEPAFNLPNPLICICGRSYAYTNEPGELFTEWANHHAQCDDLDPDHSG